MSTHKEIKMAEEVKQEETGNVPAAELTINDLNAVKTILDVASQRGAFRANELEAVGKIYNKLNAFLESVTPKQPETPEQQSETQGG